MRKLFPDCTIHAPLMFAISYFRRNCFFHSLQGSTPPVPPNLYEICQNLNVSICFYCLDTSEFGQISVTFSGTEGVENFDCLIVSILYVLTVVLSLNVNQEKTHYEGLMKTKVLPDIKMAEADYANLQQLRQVFVLLLSLRIYFYFVEILLFPYGSSVKECVLL
jgi:hypothetical protein